MTLEEALNIFNKSKYSNLIPVNYAKSKKGLVIMVYSLPGVLECNFYLVTKNGVEPTYPILCGMDPSSIKPIINKE